MEFEKRWMQKDNYRQLLDREPVPLQVENAEVGYLQPFDRFRKDRGNNSIGKKAAIAGLGLGLAGLAGYAGHEYWKSETAKIREDTKAKYLPDGTVAVPGKTLKSIGKMIGVVQSSIVEMLKTTANARFGTVKTKIEEILNQVNGIGEAVLGLEPAQSTADVPADVTDVSDVSDASLSSDSSEVFGAFPGVASPMSG